MDGKIRQRVSALCTPDLLLRRTYRLVRLLRRSVGRFARAAMWLRGLSRSHSRGVSERAQREIGPTLTQPRAQCCMESNPIDLKFMRIFRRVSGSEIDNNSLSLRQGRLRLFSLSPDANTPTGCAAEERERDGGFQPRAVVGRRRLSLAPQTN